MANEPRTPRTEADAVAEIARRPVPLDLTDSFFAVPEGFSVVTMEAHEANPWRKKGALAFVETASLVAYINDHALAGTRIEAHYDDLWIRATINGHTPEPKPGGRDAATRTAGWGDHTATFKARTHEKLAAWLAIADKPLSQIRLGEFLEERLTDVIEPDGADVMDMVLKFEATKKVAFKSSQRLHDGQRQFVYVEENEARGALTLPESFVILVPVLRGMEPQRVKFWLRYRIDDGALSLVLKMHDRSEVFREAFDRCVDAVRTGLAVDRPILVVG